MAALTRAVDDTLGLADTPARLAIGAAGGDVAGVHDSVVAVLSSNLSPAVANTETLTDTVAAATGHVRTAADTAGPTDTSMAQGRVFVGTEPLGLTDDAAGELTGGDLSATINDTAGLVDTLTAGNTVTNPLDLTDEGVAQGIVAVGTEIVGLSDNLTAGTAVPGNTRTATDPLDLTDAPITQGITVEGTEPLGIRDDVVAALGAGISRTVTDTVGLEDVDDPLRVDVEERRDDPLGLADIVNVETSGGGVAAITDSLSLSDTAALTLHITINEALGLADQRGPEPGRGITDTMQLADTATTMAALAVLISEEYQLVDSTTRAAARATSRDDLMFLSDTVSAQVLLPGTGYLTVALPALQAGGRGGALIVRSHPHRIRRTDPRRRPG
jgi:hypothetical protein